MMSDEPMEDCMPKIDKVLIAKIDADEREKCANDNEDEIVLEKEVEPREQNEMFKGNIEKPIKIEIIKTEKKEPEPEPEVVSEPDIRDEIKIEKKKPKIKKPKKLYPHLEKARAKAKENRAKRKAEKDKLKKETKEQKKEARKEKQREIARNHYWEKKAKEETETLDTPHEEIRSATANGMSYDKFSSFMDKYNLERMTAYEKRKAKREEADKVVKEKNEVVERKKRLSRNMVSRQNIRGMYVDGGEDYSDFFF